MRKLLSLLLISVLSLGMLNANPVSKEKARKAAMNVYMHRAAETVKDFTIEKEIAYTKDGMVTFYTFVFKAGGFVMISADDAAIPVLGYSATSPYKEDITNPAVKEWFDSYSNQVKAIVENKMDNKATLPMWNEVLNGNFTKDGKEVEPLVSTHWGQGSGWDTYVPAGTPVGCVATATAQVMKYYEYPETGTNWHRYTHPTYGEQTAFFFSTTYDWSAMPDNTGSDASAELSYHLGVAVNMDYAPDGSGAQTRDATFVLANYFKYDQGINFAELANYTDADWKALLKVELDNSRPMLYSGNSTASGGHAFVCDGYNASDEFHFNWGWSGYGDGYFAIGSLNPTGMDFNNGNSVVYNIQPAAAGEDEILWVSKNSNFPNESTYPGYISAVNQNVAWATGRDGSGGAADYRVYSMTKDGGATWTSQTVNEGTAFSMIHGVSADIAYIASYGTGAGNKILRTTNGGDNWDVVLEGGGSSSFFNVVHFFNENDGFVQGDALGGEYELYTTTDGGDNWTRVPGADIPDLETSGEYGIVGMYDAVGDNIWYTTNNGYIYRSTDKGYTWTKHLIMSGTSTNIEIAFADDGLVGIASVFESDNYYKYKTTDGGITWEELTYTGDFYDSGISAIPGTTNTFVSVGSDYETPHMGVSISRDGGASWEPYAEYYKIYQMTGLDMVSETKGFSGTFGGATGGGMWVLGELATIGPNFSANIAEICDGDAVTFTNESFGDAEEVLWNFGDGATPATSTEANPGEVTYTGEGAKTVTLTLTADGVSITETKEAFINVYGAPTADFTFEVDPSQYNRVWFTNTSTDLVEGVSNDTWEFGDINTLSNKPETFMYNFPEDEATYDVTLTMTTATCSDDITKTVDVVGINDAQEQIFTVYPNPGTGIFTVATDGNGTVTVMNAVGKVIAEMPVNSKTTVDLTGESTGVYFIRVKANDKVSTQRVILQ